MAGPNGGGAVGADRPSKMRRDRLKRTECQDTPKVSNLFPIERYYGAAFAVLEAHRKAFQQGDLDDAYVYGMRFCMFAHDALTRHDYYRSPIPKFQKLRLQCTADVGRVVETLEKVAVLMDAEEVQRQRREAEERRRWQLAEEARRRAEEERRRVEEADRRKREAILARAEARRRAEEAGKEFDEVAFTEGANDGGEAALTDKLDLLNDLFPKTPSGVGADQKNSLLPLASSMSNMFVNQQEQALQSASHLPIRSDLPLPLPVPAPPPNYTDVTGKKPTGDLVPQTPLPPPPSYSDVVPQTTEWSRRTPLRQDSSRKPKAKEPPFSNVRQKYTAKYLELQQHSRVEISLLSTFQGRLNGNPLRDSTNGCTVISPLVASQHLKSEGWGLSNSAIERVIDDQAPSILRAVRTKLGLAGGALIIPSDVHDYLVDRKILRQESFVGVCGGNILDQAHLGNFVNMLKNGDDSKNEKKDTKKNAAALFFHEHVISILKVVRPDGDTWFDIVDSLPHTSSYPNRRASRTRCKDRDSLYVTLKWYACSKLGESDRTYIDNNAWDEAMCDFDPRVFQGFVWSE